MSQARTTLREAAFDAVPTAVAVLERDGHLQLQNDNWQDIAEETASHVFPTEPNTDYLTTCQTSSLPRREFTTAIQAHLDKPTAEPTRILEPFNGELGEYRFLATLQSFEYESEPRELLVFVDISDVDLDALSLRERVTQLQAALQTISHDIRTPLSIAQGYAELLAAEADEQAEAPEKIQAAIARAAQITDDAMALARQPGELDYEQVDIETVARSVWTDISPNHEEATLRIDESARITANPGLLRRLFTNLFTNAIQHAGPDVTIRVGVLDEPSAATIGLFVEDDGPGLPDSSVTNLFEPGVTEGENGGYGLGLTIVQEVVRAHGWSITATNGRDGGARFEITGIHPR